MWTSLQGATFQHDRWEREAGNPNGGYGITSVLEGGAVLEKGACNISVVRGTLSAAVRVAMCRMSTIDRG